MDFIKENWFTISANPVIFMTVLITGLGVGWAAANFIFKQQIETLKERLNVKEDLIAEYRQRLGIAPTDITKYSRASNKELKKAAEELIEQMREFLNAREKADKIRYNVYYLKRSNARTEEEKDKIWDEERTEDNNQTNINTEYNNKFRANTMIIRDELLRRLPKNETKQLNNHFYELPTNPLGFHSLINELDILVKSLTD